MYLPDTNPFWFSGVNFGSTAFVLFAIILDKIVYEIH